MELYELTAHELKEKLDKEEINLQDIIESCKDRIEAKEREVRGI